MKSIFPFIPEGFQPRNLVCGSCRREFPLPLGDRYRHSLRHIIPNDFHPVTNNKFWQIKALGIPCPGCQSNTNLELPTVELRCILPLFGDEAVRQELGQKVYVLAFVGSNPDVEASVLQTWREMKARIAPDREPESWCLHTMELWKTSGKRKHPLFSTFSPHQRMAAMNTVAETFSSRCHDIFSFVGIYRSPKLTPGDKQKALVTVMATMLENLCKHGTVPKITFESDRIEDGVASMSFGMADALDKFQRSLVFAILARGLPVEDLVVAPSSESMWFEVADYVAYVVARACLMRWRGEVADLDPKRLGKVFWIGNRLNGNLFSARCEDVPWGGLGDWPPPAPSSTP